MTEVAGYRVLRTAARGTRCRLLVGHHEGDTVVLKIADADDPAFGREAEALSRAAGEHVVRLLDAAADHERAVLVLERLGGGTLGELLDRRGVVVRELLQQRELEIRQRDADRPWRGVRVQMTKP